MFGKNSDNRFCVTFKENSSGCKIIVDQKTGVNYLFSWSGYVGGITPLLDKNGEPIVTENNESV